VFFIIAILTLTLFNQVISYELVAEENTQTDEPEDVKIGPIGKLFKVFGFGLAQFVFIILRFSIVSIVAYPPYIEIGYNETKNVEVGLWNTTSDKGFQVFNKPKENTIFTERFINFKVLEYPKGTEESSWLIVLNPYRINVDKGAILKTNLSITLTKPPISGKPIQSGIIKVRLLDTWAYGGLYSPPNPDATILEKIFWFISATVLMRFGRYSGTTIVDYKDVDILVKIKPYHAVRFDTSDIVYINPDQITSIPISIQNLGNYNDTFGFRLKDENKDLKLASPYYVTLSPGEKKEINLGVYAPQSAFDFGTLHEIVIETYSLDDENVTISERQVFIETKGIYLSEMSGLGIILLILVFFLIIAFFIYRKRLRISRLCAKPDKPWEIPEEKEYLDKLIKEDKNKYKETLKMMEDEYNSSLLWYNCYCKSLAEPKRTKRKKVKPILFTKEKVKKEKIKPFLPIKEKFIKKIPEKTPKEETITKDIKKIKIEKKEKSEDLQKLKLISKIKKKEEKQKRKLLGKL
jgi:hypothetical protein